MALYGHISYREATYGGAPATIAPPVELPLYIITRVKAPGGACGCSPITSGNVVTIEASFFRGGVLADPLSLVVLIKDPSGDVTRFDYGADPQPVQTAVGKYYLQQYLEEGGEYYYRWEAGAGAAEGSFEVAESYFSAPAVILH